MQNVCELQSLANELMFELPNIKLENKNEFMIKYSVYVKIEIHLKSWFIHCASLIMHCIYIYINIFTYFTVQNLFYPHLPLP